MQFQDAYKRLLMRHILDHQDVLRDSASEYEKYSQITYSKNSLGLA